MIAFVPLFAISAALAQSGVVHRPDVDLPYKIEGHGAPILVLSGGPGFTTDYMQSIIDGVGVNKFQWILLEQRGTPRGRLAHPSSKALEMSAYIDDIEALRKQLGLKHWNVLGQSFGSMLAEAYVAAHPDRVTSLELLDTPGPDLAAFDYADDNVTRVLNDDDRKAARAASREDADPNQRALDGFLAVLPAYFYSRQAADKARPMFKPNCIQAGTIELVFGNLVREKWDLKQALHRYPGPALVIQGRQDFLGEPAAIKSARALPRGELCFVERAGHCAWVDNPKPFFARLSSFLIRNAK